MCNYWPQPIKTLNAIYFIDQPHRSLSLACIFSVIIAQIVIVSIIHNIPDVYNFILYYFHFNVQKGLDKGMFYRHWFTLLL
jgi:hypothetical protein